MKYTAILFDLDGTLSESGPGITKSAQYALHRMGIEEPDAEKLSFFVGPPLNLSFRDHYGMDEEETARAIHYFREQYEKEGVYDTRLYPGIGEMLAQLKKSGRHLAIATSKPLPLANTVLSYLGIAGNFDIISGSDPREELDNKAGADNKQQRVHEALLQLGEPLERTAMVGDRFYDIEGAKANHVAAIGVSFGYGSREELEKAGADAVADTVPELEALLMA